MKVTPRVIATFLAGMVLTACTAREGPPPARAPAAARPVVVQGAMDLEVKKLAGALENVTEETVQGWTFWSGTLDGYPVVVSKTLKGVSNAAAATVLAADRYHPIAIINQGTAGGHEDDLSVYDIVLGTYAVNLGSFKTGYRAGGQGSNFADWTPLDLMRSEGSAGQDPNARSMRRFPGDEGLLAAARSVRGLYRKGRVVEGVIGSSEIWNSEIDRIRQIHDKFGTTAEEMETASAAQIAGLFQIPFLGIRVLSNNITNGGTYDARTGEACQEYVYDVVKAYIGEKLKR
ncbi:MAG TPA: 5'-methylthioadenosine/S-adenosylhomocysteine nucleosidase [Vicinamibacterales bacterium]|jgi:adenosylhomocysteine nucleosidase|nr:5'-methylthioadenosine/S-adenosylhomocysteine nucleosidase [Vicinamibacterales bacterium]